MSIKNKKYLIFVLLVFSLIMYKIYETIEKDKALDENSKYTKAKIIDKYYIRNKGFYINYTYIVDFKKYKRSCKVLIDEQEVRVGEEFLVRYSSDDPENSELIFKEIEIDE